MTYSPPVVGIEIGANVMRVASILWDNNKLKIGNLKSIPILKNKEGELLFEDLQQPFREFVQSLKDPVIVSSLSSRDVIVRSLSLNLSKLAAVEAALPFQLEPKLPYPLEEAIITKKILKCAEGSTEVTAFSTHKKQIEQHLTQYARFGCQPEIISCEPEALANFVSLCNNAKKSQLIMYVGITKTIFALVREGKLISSRNANIGAGVFVDALREKEGLAEKEAEDKLYQEIDFENLSGEANASVSEVAKRFEREISRSLFSMKVSNEPDAHLIVTGQFSLAKGVQKYFQQFLHYQISSPSFTEIDLPTDTAQKYAIPIGLAACRSCDTEEPLDFRKGEFFYPHAFKRYRKRVLSYFSLCLLFAGILWGFGQISIDKKKRTIRKMAVSMLYNTQQNGLTDQGQTTAFADKIHFASLPKEIADHHSKLDALISPISLYSTVPLISDVLLWISKYPSIVGSQETEDRRGASLFQITNLNYVLTSHPTKNNRSSPYQARLHLQFTTTDSRTAREFHEALRTPNEMVAQGSPISWSVNDNQYDVSFTLKNRPLPFVKEVSLPSTP